MVCDKVCVTKLCVCDKEVCDKVVCDKVVCGGGGGGDEEEATRRRRRSGIQNRKQEPHTKMWEKKKIYHERYAQIKYDI